MIKTELYKNATNAFLAAALITVLILSSYFIFEPVVSRSQSVSTIFEIHQTITGEISFLTEAQETTLQGSINGLSGGQATGTTYTVVSTNDPDGYTMTLVFEYATTSGMDGENTASFINNYAPATPGTPDYGFVPNATGEASVFTYTVTASTTDDLDLTFQNNGAACATAGVDTAYQCWMNASVTPETIMNTGQSSGATPSGSTTTLRFMVHVPNNPSPSLEADTYTATATLTATNNP